MSEKGAREAGPAAARRVDVLESALRTFARHGYRRTSMEDVAREARISRPGLYLHFPSKQALLQAAVEHTLSTDVAQAEALLADDGPLCTRLLGAFDLWAGKYVGPLASDLEGLLEQDASLLGELPAFHRARFRAAVEQALSTPGDGGPAAPVPLDPHRVADVLLALAAGTKRQAVDRDDFRDRFRYGLDLLLR